MALRVAFFGTPAFAVPTLRRLDAAADFDVVLVVTQPDRPAGRGRRLERSAVGAAAGDLGLPIFQPASLRYAAARRQLAEAGADLFVVAACGLIFGPKTLALPRLGCVNVHASLLPRYRGASPVAAAILSGDEVTGVTLMRMERGLDTGPIIAVAEEPIASVDTTATLTERLAALGAAVAVDTLPRFASGALDPVPQPTIGASLTRPLSKADGWLDWERPAHELERQVRAMWSWPRAWTTVGTDALQVHAARVAGESPPGQPGRLVGSSAEPIVACGRDALALVTVQPAGARPMPGAAWLAGHRQSAKEPLGRVDAPPAQPPIVHEVR